MLLKPRFHCIKNHGSERGDIINISPRPLRKTIVDYSLTQFFLNPDVNRFFVVLLFHFFYF